MPKVFITSDNHFLHSNIVKYCNRPEDHNKLMVSKWNSVVSDEDYVIVAGDFSAGVNSYPNGLETLKKISKVLKGKKYLVKGNHDHFSTDFYKTELGFLDVLDYMIYKDYFICHFPLFVDRHTKNSDVIMSLIEKYNNSGLNKVLCGHSHSSRLEHLKDHTNVCVDLNDFTPILLYSEI
jgi:calcineurin-like phosphoesterase family protein